MVGFGGTPLPVSDSLVVELQDRSAQTLKSTLGDDDKLSSQGSAFPELDAIFMTADVDQRALLFIDLVTRQRSYPGN